MNWLDFEVEGQGHDQTVYGQNRQKHKHQWLTVEFCLVYTARRHSHRFVILYYRIFVSNALYSALCGAFFIHCEVEPERKVAVHL